MHRERTCGYTSRWMYIRYMQTHTDRLVSAKWIILITFQTTKQASDRSSRAVEVVIQSTCVVYETVVGKGAKTHAVVRIPRDTG